MNWRGGLRRIEVIYFAVAGAITCLSTLSSGARDMPAEGVRRLLMPAQYDERTAELSPQDTFFFDEAGSTLALCLGMFAVLWGATKAVLWVVRGFRTRSD